MKLLIGLLALAVAASTQAAELKIQKVKTIGELNHKVIFQSTDVKSVGKSNVVKGKIVAAWGVHVYEVANAYYTCNTKNVCKLAEVETVGMYESCTVKNNKAVCSKKISGTTSDSSARDLIVAENPDAVDSEYAGRDTYGEYDSEFPVRIVDEYAGQF